MRPFYVFKKHPEHSFTLDNQSKEKIKKAMLA
jgi:hypothetical protein